VSADEHISAWQHCQAVRRTLHPGSGQESSTRPDVLSSPRLWCHDPSAMSFARLPFSSLGWAAGAHPLEKKKLVVSHPVALLEFAPGFEDPQWCVRGHVIYVLDGALELVLDEGTEQLQAGDGCVLDCGTRHRAKNPGGVPVRLFVVSSEA
jgi:quercetin dioxygenase-like cupin family protein